MTIPLWNLSLEASPALAALIEDAWSEEALAISTLNLDNTTQVQIDMIFGVPPDVSAINARLALLALGVEAKTPEPFITQIDDTDWLQKVATDNPPHLVGRWIIAGPSHGDEITDKTMALVVNAANAFGSGEHPTTRGCLVALDKLLTEQGAAIKIMADIGCGSGILAMAFAKARGGHAIAADISDEAVVLTQNNIDINAVSHLIHVTQSDGYQAALIQDTAPYDLIMANIFANPLCEMAKDLATALRPGGTAILSGFLSDQAELVLNAHRDQGLVVSEQNSIDDWMIVTLQKPI